MPPKTPSSSRASGPFQTPSLEEWKVEFLFLSVSVLLQLVLLGSRRLFSSLREVGSRIIFTSGVLRTFRRFSESMIIDSEVLLVNKTFCSLACGTQVWGRDISRKQEVVRRTRFEQQGSFALALETHYLFYL